MTQPDNEQPKTLTLEDLSRQMAEGFKLIGITFDQKLAEGFKHQSETFDQKIADLAAMVQEGFEEVKTELRTEITEAKTELRTEIADLRTEMRQGFAQIDARLYQFQKDLEEVKQELAAVARRTKEDADALNRVVINLKQRVEYLEKEMDGLKRLKTA